MYFSVMRTATAVFDCGVFTFGVPFGFFGDFLELSRFSLVQITFFSNFLFAFVAADKS